MCHNFEQKLQITSCKTQSMFEQLNSNLLTQQETFHGRCDQCTWFYSLANLHLSMGYPQLR